MAKKINIEDIDRIIKLQNRAATLYKEQDDLYDELLEKYGDTAAVVEHADKEFPYIKVVITDNAKRLAQGEILWKSTKLARVTVETRPLKKKPKDD